MDISAIQHALRAQGIDGWLLCDFRNRDYLAYRVLGLNFEKMSSRRWYYYIPARGEPKRLVSAVEPHRLDELPGSLKMYLSWEELHESSPQIARHEKEGCHAVLSEEQRAIRRLRGCRDHRADQELRAQDRLFGQSGANVRSRSSVKKGYRTHKEAGVAMDNIRAQAFEEIGKGMRENTGVTEYDIQQFIMRRFQEENLVTYDPPMVGTNEHQADPHFDLTKENSRPFKQGDMVLIDLWAKKNVPGGIYYDITWVGYIGDTPPARYQKDLRGCLQRQGCRGGVCPGQVLQRKTVLRLAGG